MDCLPCSEAAAIGNSKNFSKNAVVRNHDVLLIQNAATYLTELKEFIPDLVIDPNQLTNSLNEKGYFHFESACYVCRERYLLIVFGRCTDPKYYCTRSCVYEYSEKDSKLAITNNSTSPKVENEEKRKSIREVMKTLSCSARQTDDIEDNIKEEKHKIDKSKGLSGLLCAGKPKEDTEANEQDKNDDIKEEKQKIENNEGTSSSLLCAGKPKKEKEAKGKGKNKDDGKKKKGSGKSESCVGNQNDASDNKLENSTEITNKNEPDIHTQTAEFELTRSDLELSQQSRSCLCCNFGVKPKRGKVSNGAQAGIEEPKRPVSAEVITQQPRSSGIPTGSIEHVSPPSQGECLSVDTRAPSTVSLYDNSQDMETTTRIIEKYRHGAVNTINNSLAIFNIV